MDFILGIMISAHLGLQGDYNSIHPMIGLEYNNYFAGAYYNSEEKISGVFGKKIEFNNDFDIEIGIVTGYNSEPILPLAKFNYKNFFVTPGYEEYNGSRVGIIIGTEWRL